MREIELIGISIDIVRSGDEEEIVPLVWVGVIEEVETVGETVEVLPF